MHHQTSRPCGRGNDMHLIAGGNVSQKQEHQHLVAGRKTKKREGKQENEDSRGNTSASQSKPSYAIMR